MRVVSAPDRDIDPGFVSVDGVESVRQRVAQRIRHWLGEWFLDRTSGVPYYRDVLVRPLSPGLALAAITHAIRQVEGVNRVSGVEGEIDDDTRTLQYRAVIHTDDGEIAMTENVGLNGSP